MSREVPLRLLLALLLFAAVSMTGVFVSAGAESSKSLGFDAPKSTPTLYWHGSSSGVARRNASGIFVDGPGNGGLFWTTSKQIDELGVGAWKIGGNTNVQLLPPRLINKGGIEATYTLTKAESAVFRELGDLISIGILTNGGRERLDNITTEQEVRLGGNA